jgi:hypothetical protein
MKQASCNPPMGQSHPHQNLPINKEERNNTPNTTRLPLIIPCVAELIIRMGEK